MIDSFLQYLQYEKSYSSRTVLSYQGDLLQFSNYLLEFEGVKFEPALLTTEQVRSWMVWMMDQGMSVSTVHRKLSSLKSFYRFLNRKQLLSYNPTSKIISPKKGEYIPSFFQEKDVDRVLEINKNVSTFEDVRDALIIELFYQTGLRCSELVGLLDADVDVDSRVIKVLGKRNKERLIPFGKELCDKLIEYRTLRENEIQSKVTAFFVLKTGKPLYSRLVYRIVTREMSMVTTQKKRGPHILRHTFATTMLNNGADLNAVKAILGHESLAATQVYTHSTFEQLYNIYQQAHPRVNKNGGLMEILIQAIKFDATEKLKTYLDKKVRKLERLSDNIQSVEIYLKVIKPETVENKEVEMSVNGLGSEIFASKIANSFEQAADECIDALEKQIKRLKEKV